MVNRGQVAGQWLIVFFNLFLELRSDIWWQSPLLSNAVTCVTWKPPGREHCSTFNGRIVYNCAMKRPPIFLFHSIFSPAFAKWQSWWSHFDLYYIILNSYFISSLLSRFFNHYAFKVSLNQVPCQLMYSS